MEETLEENDTTNDEYQSKFYYLMSEMIHVLYTQAVNQIYPKTSWNVSLHVVTTRMTYDFMLVHAGWNGLIS